MRRFNAIVLAGEGGKSRSVYGMDKALLPLEERPIVCHVLSAVDAVPEIEEIFLIGPRPALIDALKKDCHHYSKKINVLEQGKNLIENIAAASREAVQNPSGIALYVAGDIPLLTGGEIDQFLSRCDMERYDYLLGVTREEALVPFYPAEGRPGIKMAYFYFKDRKYRINNLHLARPYAVGARGYIQKVYDYRYQRDVWNIVRVAFELARVRGWGLSLSYYLLSQIALALHTLGLGRVAALPRSFLALETIERTISEIFRTRFSVVETTFGGAALDIDNEKAYEAMRAMFRSWRAHLDALQPGGMKKAVG